jgi:DEAD/DEAH box helicase domain-containing protein
MTRYSTLLPLESDRLQQILNQLDTTEASGVPVQSIQIDARPMSILPFPARYGDSRVGEYLRLYSVSDEGVFRHQSLIPEIIDSGQDVVISTATNSGKSRAFMSEAFHLLLQDKKARILVLYPYVNLNKDQNRIWKSMAESVGLDPSIIAKIDGGTPRVDRLDILKTARILIATPDVIHAWFMSNLDAEPVRRFLAYRRCTILDEVDNYTSVYGTNVQFLLRRLLHAQGLISGDITKHRYIGASATLPEPESIFSELTGRSCIAVTNEDNGAPRNNKLIIHHQVAPSELQSDILSITKSMIKSHPQDLGIVFVDSRRSCEEYAAEINQKLGPDTAIVIKSGMSREGQGHVESSIASGRARVIFATSSMEAGIDFDFAWGLNSGAPSSKRSLLQRIGRIGRKQDGIFIILAPEKSFYSGRCEGLVDYYNTIPLEKPLLYPTNKTIQIIQALCLRAERKQLKSLGIDLHEDYLGHDISWPRGFSKTLQLVANPVENLVGENRYLIPPRGMPPHRQHSVRTINSTPFDLSERLGGDFRSIGRTDLRQAMKEYPPGAIVWHQGKKWRVYEWEEYQRYKSNCHGAL